MSLAGKVIIVTGGSKGIGRAISHRLAQDGASVVVNFSRDASAAEEVISAIGGPDRALAVQADAGSVAGVEKLVAATVERFGRVDVVIPNAGIMPMRTTGDTTEEDFDRAFAVNVKGPYFLAQKAAAHMAPGGRVIFVSTGVVKASIVAPSYLLYGATKGAVEQMTRIMAKDLAAKGINVNAVAPGPTGTELFFEGKSEAMVETIKRASPFGRLGEPDDIASVVAFLSGKDSAWVAGQVIHVNGASFV
ncbi:3-oxoacyl-(acyl-carrier protein) reductase [Diaporthe helianthi]|uniref:3-oxoacyl-(Acyl-carrier protein) reductase n=1 Tax=Diaporthe helianthi TaxID=158607 RepID=A0A2P5HZ48_DIAHE|nr:3-oxoacyl-(acyl-carrier protein) reductase [Diaporthe helianthi]